MTGKQQAERRAVPCRILLGARQEQKRVKEEEEETGEPGEARQPAVGLANAAS